jgi:hypothetical protein
LDKEQFEQRVAEKREIVEENIRAVGFEFFIADIIARIVVSREEALERRNKKEDKKP